MSTASKLRAVVIQRNTILVLLTKRSLDPITPETNIGVRRTLSIHALGMFFDRIILDDQIPVFNYADTFHLDQNFDQRTLSLVNINEEVLVDVDVRYGAYQQVKSAAVAEIKTLYQRGTAEGVGANQAYNILGELANCYPHLPSAQVATTAAVDYLSLLSVATA